MDKQNIYDSIDIVREVCTSFVFKCFVSLFYALFTFGFSQANYIGMMGVFSLMFFHWFTGIVRAFKDGEIIRPTRWWKMFLRGMIYTILIACAHITEISVFHIGESFFLDEMVIGFLAFTEFASVVQNCARMGFALPKRLLNRIHDMEEELVDGKVKRFNRMSKKEI